VTDELCRHPAVELAELLRRREVSAVELLEAHLERIERLDPLINAIPTRSFELARAEAREGDARLTRGEDVGPLHGLPVAFKDLQPTAGIRTTKGARALRDWIPDTDSLTVARMREAGAIGVGKTNVPEFGAGSQTYNPVFGPTRNPYDPSRTPGGSSGGAAAALAAGFIALADGSDYGGSLRNPASFCNVVGFRTTRGRVPDEEPDDGIDLSVDGPLGRTVRDVALLLSVMAGPDRRAAAGMLADPGETFRDLVTDVRGRRTAFAPRFAGLPVEREVSAVVEAAAATFEAMRCRVEAAEPDVTDADIAFHAPRHVVFRMSIIEQLGDRVADLKPELRWHLDEGARVTAEELAAAAAARARLRLHFATFMERFDALVVPVSQVLPFPVEVTWPRAVAGAPMATYLDWMRSCWYVSLLDAPAMSVPAAFVGELPVGVQIVGRSRDELGILQLAAAFEEASGELWRRPPSALAS
jgi:amidase